MSIMKKHSSGKLECMCDREDCMTFFDSWSISDTEFCKEHKNDKSN